MNIVYLIGNGFDVAQGLRTRYPDFYESYKHSVPVNEVEHQIIEAIDEHQEDWSDMERELGRFTSQINNAEGFIDAYESLSDKLKEYLRVQESQYTPSDVSRYQKEIANPFEDLSFEEYRFYQHFISSFPGKAYVNIISFNYTNVFEQAIGYQYRALELSGPFFSEGIQLNNVYKVHGSLQGYILMGVNDKGQVANMKFAENPDICDFLVKPEANSVIGMGFDILSTDIISAADLIIVYGMSIGATDKIWWKKIAERMSSSKTRLIIFHYLNDAVPTDRLWKKGRIERQVKRNFENVAEIPSESLDEIDSRITVCLKGYLFNKNVYRFDKDAQRG